MKPNTPFQASAKRDLPAVCPLCKTYITPGTWVRRAPGVGSVIAHAYRCPTTGR